MKARNLGILAIVAATLFIAALLIVPELSPFQNLSGGTTTGEEYRLELIAEGLAHPVAAAVAPGIDDRTFVVDQVGTVRMLLSDGTLVDEAFLDLRDQVIPLDPSYDERGLLSMAFHPNFTENRKLYVFYSAPLRPGAPPGYDHTNVVVEYTTSPDDPLEVDLSSARTVLAVDHPARNHNGGQVLFGPDGYLYITLGDGGGANDEGLGHNDSVGNGQDVNTLFGKVLRVDVDNATDDRAYSIPEANPFADGGGRPEIFAWGFRNPAYATFDNRTGRLFVADAGQARYEEVDLVVVGGNYGWRIREGAHCFDPDRPTQEVEDCPDVGPNGEPLIDPIVEFRNSRLPGGLGATVVGGTLYRGNISGLAGDYIFGAFEAGGSPLLVAAEDNGTWSMSDLDGLTVPDYLLAVSTGVDGEVLVLSADNAGPSGTTGKVWRLVPTE